MQTRRGRHLEICRCTGRRRVQTRERRRDGTTKVAKRRFAKSCTNHVSEDNEPREEQRPRLVCTSNCAIANFCEKLPPLWRSTGRGETPREQPCYTKRERERDCHAFQCRFRVIRKIAHSCLSLQHCFLGAIHPFFIQNRASSVGRELARRSRHRKMIQVWL